MEQKNKQLTETTTKLQHEALASNEEADKLSRELANLRQSSLSSQGSWHKERETMVMSERKLRDKLRETEKSANDWELIAIEERTIRENSSRRIYELEEQLQSQKEFLQKAVKEQGISAETIKNLQHAINEMQEGMNTFSMLLSLFMRLTRCRTKGRATRGYR